MAERLAQRPDLIAIRRSTVEHPFGTIQKWMNQGAFLTRRIEYVRGEFSLTALVCNIRGTINLVGVRALLQAVRG